MKLPENIHLLRVVCAGCGQTVTVTRSLRIAAHYRNGFHRVRCTGPAHHHAAEDVASACASEAEKMRGRAMYNRTQAEEHTQRAAECDRDAAALDAIAAKLGGAR